jgi:hypothetical protein
MQRRIFNPAVVHFLVIFSEFMPGIAQSSSAAMALHNSGSRTARRDSTTLLSETKAATRR